MSEEQNFSLIAGRPWSEGIRITGGTIIWGTPEAVEARMHIRKRNTSDSDLVCDFTPYLQKEISGEDIRIFWSLTGAEVTALNGGGYYDLVVSDPGATDARSLPPLISGRITINTPITTAEDVP